MQESKSKGFKPKWSSFKLPVGRKYVPPLGALVSEAFGNIPYGLDQESNNTDDSEHKDYVEGKRVQHCTAETEETCAVKEVNDKTIDNRIDHT